MNNEQTRKRRSFRWRILALYGISLYSSQANLNDIYIKTELLLSFQLHIYPTNSDLI